MHTPVFLEQVVEALAVKPGRKYIDGTVGEGGHLNRIVEAGGKVLGLDYDSNQIEKLRNTLDNSAVTLVHSNFKDILQIARKNGFGQVDGILLDLGLSMSQLAESGKGLSFRKGHEPLLMRLPDSSKTAADVLNNYSQPMLKEVFELYGEERHADKLAHAIVSRRKSRSYTVVADLLSTLDAIAVHDESLYARIFQALRIEVNDELENLKQVLTDVNHLLFPGGRLVIITFHSIEDRIVKRWGRQQKSMKELKIRVSRQHRRSFERSAQLRIYEHL